MTAIHPNADDTGWTQYVITYLRQAIPERKTGEWDHYFTSAYQMGVMALIALGQAEETKSGAIELARPKLPDTPPRWDDICCAVLSLMMQHGEIGYRNLDGAVYEPTRRMDQFAIRQKNPPPIPAPNITSGNGCGPARAAPQALELLKILWLVHNGRWTPEAELVLWRIQPPAWELIVPESPRFQDALGVCLASLPQDEANEIASLVNVIEEDISDSLKRHSEWIAEQRQKFGPKANLDRTPDRDSANRSLVFQRSNLLDWMFFRSWRLPDGWLLQNDRSSALEIFHDPLATQMRRAVVRQLHPNSDVAKAT